MKKTTDNLPVVEITYHFIAITIFLIIDVDTTVFSTSNSEGSVVMYTVVICMVTYPPTLRVFLFLLKISLNFLTTKQVSWLQMQTRRGFQVTGMQDYVASQKHSQIWVLVKKAICNKV